MRKLDNKELQRLDNELFKFHDIDKSLRLRREELTTRNPDAAQSGGHTGISKPTESMAIKLVDDPTIKYLEGFKSVVNELVKLLIDDDLKIFNMRWHYPFLKWEEIAEKEFVSSATIYRRRRIILEQYASLKGDL